MNTISKLPNHQERYDEASLWIAKLERELTAEEKLEFGAWMNACSENQDLLLKMAEHWDKLDSLSRLSAVFPHHPADQACLQSSAGLFQRLSGWADLLSRPVLVAPLVIIITAIIVFARFESSGANTPLRQFTYETAVGDQSSVMLADGSYLRLNTNTLVELSYSSEQRLLNLIRGELNIEVAHDSNRPLRVQANGRVVEAIGTAFNVEITEDQEVELVVTEGKVVVTVAQNTTQQIAQHRSQPIPDSSQTRSSVSPAFPIAVEPIAVSAGEEILLGSPNQELKKILPEETVVKLSWQQGNLVFRGESLEEAMAEVGRYTPVEFVFLDEKCKHVRIAGLFKAGDTENLLSALRENFHVTHEWVGSEKVLLSSL